MGRKPNTSPGPARATRQPARASVEPGAPQTHALASPWQRLSPADILQLQRSLGNRQVARTLGAAQPGRPAATAQRQPQPRASTIIQRDETIPDQDTEMKVEDILKKLDALALETKNRMQTLAMILDVIKRGLHASGAPGQTGDDFEVKIAALELQLDQLNARLKLLGEAHNGYKEKNKKIKEPWKLKIPPLPETMFMQNLLANDQTLGEISEWFDPDTVERKKHDQKLLKKQSSRPPLIPETLDSDTTEKFLKQDAGPLLSVDYGMLVKKFGEIIGGTLQGVHDSREKNLPPAKLKHKTWHLIELSIGLGDIDGARAVVDVELGRVYVTAHYGQNIVKMITQLAKKEDKTPDEIQQLSALMFLKKLVNDFVLVKNLPDEVQARLMKVACKTYLENHLTLEKLNPPPINTALQSWCGINLPIKLLTAKQITEETKIAWGRWMRYFHGLDQLFVLPDGLDPSNTAGIVNLCPLAYKTVYATQLTKHKPKYGELGVVSTIGVKGMPGFHAYFIGLGSVASPSWQLVYKVQL